MGQLPVSGDIGDLMGLRTVAAKALVVVFIGTFALVGVMTRPAGSGVAGWLAEIGAWLVTSAAAVALIQVPGDPLRRSVTAVVAAAGPVATVSVLLVVDDPGVRILTFWPLSATTALCTYLCVRGRTGVAWVSMLAAIGATALWAVRIGEGAGYGISISLINLAPLVMSSFFAITIRPAAREIFLMQGAGTEAAATEAARRAVLDERDRQLGRLDDQARPLLARLADAAPLSADERDECSLVEARLRDSLRAPTFDVRSVADAARQARRRGVEVILLDDHGLVGADDDVRERVIGGAVTALAAARAGTVTIRILPPRRRVVATVLQVAGDVVVREEYDGEGRLVGSD
ncbi:hypothetical protein Y710_10645 [Gordonia sp. QH-12]|uniref:hypothetical protein n=1 Tax=Gordonia sp. QH-12 TaxID=1437876 RepID=UPI000781EC43|nr:hypothetical protein [Gordonia sp. QH-12]KXT56938.1 hypothetical protein Y710_10645 [Gordonia sp. QH-12]